MLLQETRCEMNIMWFLRTGNERNTGIPPKADAKILAKCTVNNP